MKVKLHSNQTGNLSAALLRASVAPSSAEVSPAAGAAASENATMLTSIISPKSDRGLIVVGETGYKSTLRHNRATRFETEEAARKFAAENGVFNVEFRPATNATHIPKNRR